MDDDWDLHAVVKGCSAAVTTTNVSTTAGADTSTENPFPSFSSSMTFHDHDKSSFDFQNFIDYENDPFQGLQEIYQEFCGDPPPSTASVPAAQGFQPHQEIMQIQPSLEMNMQMQGNNVELNKSFILGSSSHSFPAMMNSQPTRPRRRKNQQTKMVRQMTQEELSADSWAWRKYGQKPIKGSPYPRNYYRCSTSKGCAARKQVERSPNDTGIFIVSYSGEHTHPRPTHRSSLAGSTRPKLPITTTRNMNNMMNYNNTVLIPKGPISSSSSPCTPLLEGEIAAHDDDNVEIIDQEDGYEEDDDNGDMFKGFHGYDDHESSGRGGDGLFSSGLLSSPP